MTKTLQKRDPLLDPQNNSVAPTRVAIDLETLKDAASIGCTYDEISVLLHISPSTFDRYVRDSQLVRDALEEGRAMGRGKLRRMQWHEAEKGNPTMLIWLGKQLLGQRDKQPDEEPAAGRVRYVVEMPAPVASEDEWMKRYAPPEIEGSVDGQPT